MRNKNLAWTIGLLAIALIILIPILIFWPRTSQAAENPWAHKPVRPPQVDHTALMPGPYESGPEVTQACLECHEEAAFEVMSTVHWTWESQPYDVSWRDEPVTIGKKNQLNNYCIGIQSNWAGCTSCHAGYGWDDANFDFSKKENIDCLVCHDLSGLYIKGEAGWPAEGVDLTVAAQSVGWPNRNNCGGCHFNGGGGNGVKHGDLDQSLINPDEELDIHMGKYDFVCIDCHQTEDHKVKGRSLSVSLDFENQVACTDCHTEKLHDDPRINDHTDSVACQTCHIPEGALKDPTKMNWDWSTAGQDLPEDVHTFLKIKGSFVYENDFIPEYFWYDGLAYRYIMGDKIDPSQPTLLNPPAGDINDPNAKIYPFKIHRAKQPYDTVNNILLQPRTAGEGGFWDTFDWESALLMGAKDAGQDYSGEYGFAETWMHMLISHMVQPAEDALQCDACHSPNGRLDWKALGYPGDPIEWGGRK